MLQSALTPDPTAAITAAFPPLAWFYGRISKDRRTKAERDAEASQPGYVRCSSLDKQEEQCLNYASMKTFLIDPARMFADDDVSGTVPVEQRPGGAALFESLRAAQGLPNYKHLVILKLDRLGRNSMDLWKQIEGLDALDVALHIVDFGGDVINTKSAMGRMMLKLLAVLAEFEVDMTTDRIQGEIDRKFTHGELIGTVPFGWNAVGTGEFVKKNGTPKEILRLEDNPVEQAVLIRLYLQRKAGLSYHHLAQSLNLSLAPRKSGAVGGWTAGNIHRMLHSRHVKELLLRKLQAA